MSISFDDLGGIPNDSSFSTALHNAELLNRTLQSLEPNTIFRITGKYHTLGGIVARNLINITIVLDGELSFSTHISHWPRSANRRVLECLDFPNPANLTLTSTLAEGGIVNGNGWAWWDLPALGYLLRAENRPRLLHVRSGTSILLERWTFVDSPYWTAYFSNVDGLEIRHTGILNRRTRRDGHSMVDMTAFNTDGFDVSGQNAWIHDVDVWCQDDAIAVKDESRDMLFERINASGLGVVIGSIANSVVRNVTFRDMYLHKPWKGIYFKFRRSEYAGVVEDVLVENVVMDGPIHTPIWIGPAQQSDRRSLCYANPCSLCWPAIPWAKCAGMKNGRYKNITLRNITIHRPTEAGVLMGHESNVMERVVFDSVRVTTQRIAMREWKDAFPLLPIKMGPGVRSDRFVTVFRLAIVVTILLAMTPLYEMGTRIAKRINVKKWCLVVVVLLLPLMVWTTYLRSRTNRIDQYFKCEHVEGVALGDTYPVPYCFRDETDGGEQHPKTYFDWLYSIASGLLVVATLSSVFVVARKYYHRAVGYGENVEDEEEEAHTLIELLD